MEEVGRLGAAFNTACLEEQSRPADCLFGQVAISGLGGGDESQEDPEVNGPWG